MVDTILRIINTSCGITNQDLRLRLMGEGGGPTTFSDNEYRATINRLVETNRVIEVQYVIPPSHPTKMKVGSLYLPERSVVVMNTANDFSRRRRR